MRSWKVWMWVVFLGLCFGVQDRVFAEEQCAPCPTEDTEKKIGDWDRLLSFGYDKTSGNSDTSMLAIKGVITREKEDNIWRFAAEERYGETDDEKKIDYSKAVAEYKRLLSDRLYAGMGISASRDDIADVDYRVSPNPVLGYFLLKNERTRLNLEVGPSYLFEKVGGIKDDYLAPRVGERFELQITDNAKLFQAVELTFSAEDSENYLVEAEAGIEAAITTLLSLIASVKDTYDNQPALDKERNDIAILTSLGVRF